MSQLTGGSCFSPYLYSPVLADQPSWGQASPPEPTGGKSTSSYCVHSTGHLPHYHHQITLDSDSTSPKLFSSPGHSGKKKSKKSGGKSTYKHVPHREKPAHLVARRNARERRRVQAVNNAFARLRKCVPVENRNKRLSKVKTLHRAIEYIHALQDMLSKADAEVTNGDSLHGFEDFIDTEVGTLNKENEANPRWISTWEQDSHGSCLSLYDDFADPMYK